MNLSYHGGHNGFLPWLALGLALLGHGAAVGGLMLIGRDKPEQPPTLTLTASWITEPSRSQTPGPEVDAPSDTPPPNLSQPKQPPKSIAEFHKALSQPAKTARHPTPEKKPRPTRPYPKSAPTIEQKMQTPTEPLPVSSAAAPTRRQTTQIAHQPAPVIAPRFQVDYLSNPPPSYPRKSRYLGEEGKVLLKVRVSESGDTLGVLLHKSSGFNRLDQAALNAVRQWKFVPARRGREQVAVWVVVPLEFSLRKTR